MHPPCMKDNDNENATPRAWPVPCQEHRQFFGPFFERASLKGMPPKKHKNSRRSHGHSRTSDRSPTVGTTSAADDGGPTAISTAVPVPDPPAAAVIYGTGRFQMMVLFCAQLALFVTMVHYRIIYIMARPIDHWCKQPEENASLSTMEWKNAGIPMDSSGNFKRCSRYDLTTPPFHNDTEVPCDSWDYDEDSGGRHRSIVGEFDLVCNRSFLINVQAAIYTAGAALAMPLTGLAADRLGRRPVELLSLFVILVSGLSTALARTLPLFAALRCLLSASLSSFQVMVNVLLFEVTPSSYRTTYCTLAAIVPKILSPFFLSIMAFLRLDWPFLQMLAMVPTSLLIASIHVTDESPLWLMSSWKFQDASRVILWAAGSNGQDLEKVRVDLHNLKQDVVSRQSFVTKPSLVEMVSKQMRFRSFVIFGGWCVFFNSVTVARLRMQISVFRVVTVLANVPVMVANFYVMKKWGCRLPLAASMLTFSVFFIIEAALTAREDYIAFNVVMTVIILFQNVAFVSLFVYTIELFPTGVRCLSFSAAAMFGELGGFVTPIAAHILYGDARSQMDMQFLVTGISLILFGTLIIRLPETLIKKPKDTLRGMLFEDYWNFQTHSRDTRGDPFE